MESNAKMTVETRDSRFKDVVGNAVDITLVRSGYITGQSCMWKVAACL